MHLQFDDLYENTHTKPLSLTALAPPDSDVSVLEGLRELTTRRNLSAGNESFQVMDAGEGVAVHIERFESYLALLNQFLQKAALEEWSLALPLDDSSSKWTSPLSALPPSTHFALPPHLIIDQMMTYGFYAAALQQHAFQLISSPSQESTAPTTTPAAPAKSTDVSDTDSILMAAAVLYRKAAGVYAHVKTNLLPTVTSIIDGAAAESPVELSHDALEALETLCLAQAQAVAAQRAELKGASNRAVATVHSGVVDLFELAAAILRELQFSRQISERLRKWIGVSSELHAAMAARAQAGVCREEGELGVASACLLDGINRVQRCLVVAANEKQWQTALRAELKKLESVRSAYDKQRMSVYMQGVAGKPAAPLQGKVVVAAVVYEPVAATERYFM